MSKFFTYEDRLNLQKYLKDSVSFKEIARRIDKNPTTISREVRKYSSEIATGIPVFHSMHVRIVMNAGRKKSVEKSALVNLIFIVSSASPVIGIAQTLLKKSVRQDFVYLMSAMDVNLLVNALF